MRALLSLGIAYLLFTGTARGQARIVFNNDAYLVIDNAAQLVIDNPNPNAITVNPSGANIVSEDEDDLLRWNIAGGTGLFVIPWTTENNIKIPLGINITAAGAGTGHFLLSTHPDNDALNNWNNFDYRPSDVTNMSGPGIPNNSANVIDRFWRIQQTGYATAPQATLSFAYDDAERTNPGNTIPAGSMFAQQFDAGQGAWYMPGSGTDNHPVLVVSGASASPFFRSWTLSVLTVPLPVSGLRFDAEKAGPAVRLDWEVDEMRDVEAFVVERSRDGLSFTDLEEWAAQPDRLAYEGMDPAPFAGLNHYRLRIRDLNGALHHSGVRTVLMGDRGVRVFPNPSTNGMLSVELMGMEGERLSLRMVDMAGRVLELAELQAVSGREMLDLDLNGKLAAGVYLLEVSEPSGQVHRQKVVLR